MNDLINAIIPNFDGLLVCLGGLGGAFTATTETLTGTYRALNTVVANGVGMFVKIA